MTTLIPKMRKRIIKCSKLLLNNEKVNPSGSHILNSLLIKLECNDDTVGNLHEVDLIYIYILIYTLGVVARCS